MWMSFQSFLQRGIFIYHLPDLFNILFQKLDEVHSFLLLTQFSDLLSVKNQNLNPSLKTFGYMSK